MDQMAVGQFIAKKRKEKNLTQAQLAEKLGVSNKTISKWECGKCMPDYSIVEALCAELGITLNELIDGEEVEKSIRTYDNESIMEMLEKQQRRKNMKILMMGYVFGIMGMVMFIMSKFVGGTQFQDFISGFMMGMSIVQMLAGILLIGIFVARGGMNKK